MLSAGNIRPERSGMDLTLAAGPLRAIRKSARDKWYLQCPQRAAAGVTLDHRRNMRLERELVEGGVLMTRRSPIIDRKLPRFSQG